MEQNDPALRLSQVLLDECEKHFHEPIPNGLRTGSAVDTPEYMAQVYEHLHNRDRWALCLSGGGIRSATFGLGLLQGLASRGLLSRFDFLSTVSGGGYIGSWLSAWANRKGADGKPIGIEAVEQKLAEARGRTTELAEIRHLRDYSNYLTPKLGLTSADTWTGIGIYLRNLLLHWLMLVPLFVLPMIPAYVGWRLLQMEVSGGVAWLALAIGAVALFWSAGFLSYNLPSARPWPLVRHLFAQIQLSKNDNDQLRLKREIADIQGRNQKQFLLRGLLPAMAAAGLLSLALAWFWRQHDPAESALFFEPVVIKLKIWFGAYWQMALLTMAGAIGRCVAWCVALRHVWMTNREIATARAKLAKSPGAAAGLEPSHELSAPIVAWELIASLLSGAVGGLIVGLSVSKILGNPFVDGEMFGTYVSALTHMAIYICLAPPLYMLAFLVAESLFIGLTSYVTRDEDREWWGRAGGWMLATSLGWLLFHLLVIFGPVVIEWLIQSVAPALNKYGSLPGLLSVASGAATAFLGSSSKTPAPGAKAEGGMTARMRGVVITLSAAVFIVTLFAGLAWLLCQTLYLISGRVPVLSVDAYVVRESFAGNILSREAAAHWFAIFVIAAGLALIGVVAWRSINVNRFSMHATYRERLIRCYLGAARGDNGGLRHPDCFTGFDPNDNLSFRDLVATREKRVPLHIVNMAVNLVSDKMLGWQQRKAASFTASPLHAGSDILDYRPMSVYGGHDGMSLGTAMAISGAAASPNMGYHSSAIVTLILALFNVRLGWWLGNPRVARRTKMGGRPVYSCDGPIWAVQPLIAECFGLTNRRSDFVYLSDGGHFENLGLYEMVRRRCCHIVVSDAGCDPGNAFADLGNAIRKIRVDLGIDITMKAMFLEPRSDKYTPGTRRDGFYCAIGTISYPDRRSGTLIYIKPGLYGDEPRDVLNYACENADFPHEPTSDQWFSETQFESYRRLGEYVAGRVFGVLDLDTAFDQAMLAEAITKNAKVMTA
ncbi:MAG TPA: patatin-like phospholipase family protein [Verrucomicrobiae bacterium]|nr:patatin-like phospholipase family protein [Verrucomicrobiae bacterium]